MKNILGLDLGTTSIGWAVVNEGENSEETSSIAGLGVRVIPLTVDEQNNFEKGKPITTNADRTLKRGMRRNLQRYKLRRDCLVGLLKANGFISDDTVLAENGNGTTFETYRLRAKAATEELTLGQLARVLMMINKKRGYKSNRKERQKDEDGHLIDGMDAARKMYDEGLTPGQYAMSLLKQGKRNLPDFYRSDLKEELDRIWDFQRKFRPDLLTDRLKAAIDGKNKSQTWAVLAEPFGIKGMERKAKGDELKRENYEWRAEALEREVDLERLAIVIQEVNGQMKASSGYLGDISDRSKELYFRQMTVGQYLMSQLDNDPNCSLKNQVFYRQDYLDEFERIWETQAKYHGELTPELKHEVRDVVIFYQRPLKSLKGLVSHCEFESREVEVETANGKKRVTMGLRVCPKSSPLYQEFRIWQVVNNVQVSDQASQRRFLDQEEKETLARELCFREKMTKKEVLKLLFANGRELDLNYREIKGNTTMAALVKACLAIVDMSGHGQYDAAKMTAKQVMGIIEPVFNGLGFDASILRFDSSLDGKAFAAQPAYRLWHLLYSFEGDKSKTGNEKLIERISGLCGFDKEYAAMMAGVTFEPDYGSLSAKAIRKILPYMKDGKEYSKACRLAGYRHSARSLTKEEIEAKPLKERIELLPRNSLRNPVVEKILNQMVNVVNAAMAKYGRFDEIRIEMARELKKSAAERSEMTDAIKKTTDDNEKYRKLLHEEFGLKNVSRNDIIRYRLYLELKENGFKTLYSGTYVPREKLFSKEFDIEHIIPQAKLFDDSFANKTLESRAVNIEKSSRTARDYVFDKYGNSGLEDYKKRVEALHDKKAISRTKLNRLLMAEADIPEGFINRELNDTQYIARKAREMLESVTRTVTATTGSVTDRLRDDWQLVDVMKELNWDKYSRLGLTEVVEDRDGRRIHRIKDWTKRNDHRHHAMDALTIAFTKPSYIQYLNNLNARSNRGISIYAIEKKELSRDNGGKGKLRFLPPMPQPQFRAEAKRRLQAVLVSIKAKNKVVTRNVNTTKTKTGTHKKVQLTPRGQLHNETIYGCIRRYEPKEEKVNASFNKEKIMTVACRRYREALLRRLRLCYGDPKKAFTGRNSLDKNPLFVDERHTEKVPPKVKTVTLETVYTQRQEVNKDLKVDKVVDARIKKLLEERLRQHGGDAKKAFANLDDDPIWLNKEKGIRVKRVTITGKSSVVALHDKRDNRGRPVLDKDGKKQPTDFVSTSNNHHVAIFRDADGNLQEHLVSFYEATARAIQHLPIIEKDYNKDKGWQFLFTMKQNEYFVFPNAETGFDPKETDLLDPKNYAAISPNLFRVQKISKKNYMFRHHLETTVEENMSLKNITWKNLRSLNDIDKIVKVRVNHLGQIVAVGEY